MEFIFGVECLSKEWSFILCFVSPMVSFFKSKFSVTCCRIVCVSINHSDERLRLICYALDARQFGKSIFQDHFQEIVKQLLVETFVLKCVQNLECAPSSVLVPKELVKDIRNVCHEQVSNFQSTKKICFRVLKVTLRFKSTPFFSHRKHSLGSSLFFATSQGGGWQ